MSTRSGNLFVGLWIGEETYPNEHAAERPDKVVQAHFLDNAPFIIHALAAAGFHNFFAVFQDRAHGLHSALVVAA